MARLSNAFAALELEEAPVKKSSKKKKAGAAATAQPSAEAELEPAVVAEAPPPLERGSPPLDEPLVWIDCEMTGLDPYTCVIIEIAVLITDGQLSRVVEGPDLVIHHPDSVLSTMNEWCVEHHGESGLTERVRASQVSLADAEHQVLRFVKQWTGPGQAQLAGNSVHADLAFLKRHMPALAKHLHYRIVDVSSVRELAKRWFPSACRNAPRKTCQHTAKADILESLEELRWLRKTVFKAGIK